MIIPFPSPYSTPFALGVEVYVPISLTVSLPAPPPLLIVSFDEKDVSTVGPCTTVWLVISPLPKDEHKVIGYALVALKEAMILLPVSCAFANILLVNTESPTEMNFTKSNNDPMITKDFI